MHPQRTVYVNLPLPPDALDEDGNPVAQYARNKIRTAKYTPLSFLPKNLWLQFHNVANIYFLFVVILAVGYFFRTAFLNARADSSRFSQFSVPRIPSSGVCLL